MEEINDFQIIDPDYQKNCALTSRNKGDTVIKTVKNIIRNEFDKELSDRQNQIEHIEMQICKVQKLLHLVRYAVVKSYYNRPELEYNQSDQEYKDFCESDDQRRLHPAVKRILGANAQFTSQNRSMRKTTKRQSTSPHVAQSENPVQSGEVICNTNILDTNADSSCVKSIKKETENIPLMLASRKRVKQSIIVGNISQWITSAVEDFATEVFNKTGSMTHKWMAYVRGPKESPEISSFVEKVVFYLHPSFKPHDILEISKPPFHLKKTGWGEFPLRVKIHFKNPLNKPVDIIHNLKLPKEHPGKQVLGNETVAVIYLHEEINSLGGYIDDIDPNPPKRVKTELEDIDVDAAEDVNMFAAEDIKSEIDESASTSLEHDYCFADMEMDIDIVKHEVEEIPDLDLNIENNEIIQTDELNESADVLHLDHCYSLPQTSENFYPKLPPINNSLNLLFHNNDSINQTGNLSYGLGDNYATTYESNHHKNFDTQNRNKTQYSSANNIKEIRACVKIDKSFPKQKVLSRMIRQDHADNHIGNTKSEAGFLLQDKIELKGIQNESETKLRMGISNERYKNMGEILPYLFRKLPLHLEPQSRIMDIHPFMAKSYQEFSSWNIGKRLNSEWIRARTILRILKTLKIVGYENWNTRSLIMYGRSHGYTSVTSFNIYSMFRKNSPETDLLIRCYSHHDFSGRKFSIDKQKVESDISVDVEADNNEFQRKASNLALDITDGETKLQCSYIKHCALDCGVILKSEEIDNGIVVNGAETMILEAMKSLSDNLIRRAMNYVVCGGSLSKGTLTIQKEHVQMAIQERREIKAILEFSIVRKNKNFFT